MVKVDKPESCFEYAFHAAKRQALSPRLVIVLGRFDGDAQRKACIAWEKQSLPNLSFRANLCAD